MNALYWVILGGLGVVVLLVLIIAVADVLVTARRGRVRTLPHRSGPGNGLTDNPAVLPPEAVERFNAETSTQPLYRRDHRWDRQP